jgi:hypothetical protein
VRARLLQIKAAGHFYLGHYRAAIRVLDQVRAAQGVGRPRAAAHRAQPGDGLRRARPLSRSIGRATRRRTGARHELAAGAALSVELAFLLAELGELAEARAPPRRLASAQRFANRAQMVTCHQVLPQILARGGMIRRVAALRQAEELNAELRMEVRSADPSRPRPDLRRSRRAPARGRVPERGDGALPVAPGRSAVRAAGRARVVRAAGGARVARDLLRELVAKVDADENDDRRMRVHYWLAEAQLALGVTRPPTRTSRSR